MAATKHGAEMFSGVMAGGEVKPAADDNAVGETGGATGEKKKGFLSRIFGDGAIPKDAEGGGEHHALVAAQKRGEGALVAGRVGAKQRVVVGVVGGWFE
jgi:hypothetical protein